MELQISFSTFYLQWLVWTVPEQGSADKSVISEFAAKQLIKDLKLNKQEVLEDRDEDNEILIGYDIYFKVN